jgi:hypothetical protein
VIILTAKGDKEKTKKGKNILLWAIFAPIIVIILIWIISSLVMYYVG